MRLFELAKELNTSSRELLRQATGLNVEVATYISELDGRDVDMLRSEFKRRHVIEIADEESSMRRKLEAKRYSASEISAKITEKNTYDLSSAIERTKTIHNVIKDKYTEKTVPPKTKKAEKEEKADVNASTAEKADKKRADVESDAKENDAEKADEKTTEAIAETPEMASVDKGDIASSEEPKPVSGKSGLKDLPPRPMQDPRPEVQIRSAAPAPALDTKSEALKKSAKKDPVNKELVKEEVPVPSKPATIKKPKRPVAFHPDDEEDEMLDLGLRSIRGMSSSKSSYTSMRYTSRKNNDSEDHGDRSIIHNRGGNQSAENDVSQKGFEKKARAEASTQSLSDDIAAKVLHLSGPVVVKDMAIRLNTRPNIIIAQLMKMGILASINQSVESDVAAKIAQLHGFTVEQERSRRSSENKPVLKRVDADDEIPQDRPDQLSPRPPVVTFLGHVDHGKTSLMDKIRKTNVVSGEAGGITQHIGAYTVDVGGRQITFLDTPGHAAFSAMRARGASLTDIAVIIIAADDGIMPQTKEAIRHAREADVTIMIAINKCDLPQANPERVMQQLQGESLTPEDWGGDTVVCKVSAHTGEGIPNLLDMIQLQADVLELTSNPNRRANGIVIEAQMETGSGPTASILVTGGTLNVGDIMLCGEYYGKIRALIDSTGKRIRSVKPSGAAKIMGLSGVPEAGAEFRVMKTEKRARELAEEYSEQKKMQSLGGVTQARSVDEIFRKMHDAGKLNLDIILRADVQGSVEAIEDSIKQIKSEKVLCNIIQSGMGAITSNDVQHAASCSAIIVGFNVSPESGSISEARHNGVRVKTFRIIYELLDFIKQEMLDRIPVEHKEVIRGHAHVKQVFILGRIGIAAGCVVDDGVVLTSGKVRVFRNKKLIHTGPFASLKHFKNEVKEVTAGQECGILLSGFEDFNEGDVIECFILEALPKSL